MNRIENKKKFFDVDNANLGGKNLQERHQPIMIEPIGLDCGYVVKNYDAPKQEKNDSFVVVLYHSGARFRCKFVKF